jgi:hypothetical protein
MTRLNVRWTVSVLATAALIGLGVPAAAAPAQLLNKSLVLSWTTSLTQRAPDGQTVSRQLSFNRTIYVSSNGRLFQRATRSSARMQGTSELGPGDKAFSKTGEAAGMRFAGDRLVGNVAFAAGAAQFTVSFGAGFSSCSVDVSLGREGGQMRRKGLDGRMYEILSATVSGQSCSVRDGNLLAA